MLTVYFSMVNVCLVRWDKTCYHISKLVGRKTVEGKLTWVVVGSVALVI